MAELQQLAADTGNALRQDDRIRPRLICFGGWVLLVTLLFSRSLADWLSFSLHSTLYSHALLMPVVAVYLAWTTRLEWAKPEAAARGSPWLGGLTVLLGAALVGALWWGVGGAWPSSRQDRLWAWVSAYVLLLVAGLLVLFGRRVVASLTIPVGLLLLAAPFPQALEAAIETFFQHTSADASAFLFTIAGAPVFREGLVFHLPGLVMEVAQECSGIRSTLVLFITSLAAGYLFLHSPVKRALLVCFVVPLGIARNGIRIFTIGMLCVQISPEMIHSWVHRKGGPLFFLLSLVPFFLLLYYLQRSERRRAPAKRPNRAAAMVDD